MSDSPEKDLERRWRQAQRMEAAGRLARGVAHDFNNLLTTINGYSELLLMQGSDEDPHRRALKEIHRAGQRASELVHRLLTFSRQRPTAPRCVDLPQLIGDLEPLLRKVLGEDVLVETELGEPVPAIRADPAQIEQLLLLLAFDARDAMPRGGRLSIVAAGAATAGAGDSATLVLRHSGEEALSAEESLVADILRDNRANLETSAAAGGGTVWRLAFPVSSGASSREGSTAGIGGPRSRERVLLVEDEEPVRSLVHRILEMQGYRVHVASDVSAALGIYDDLDEPPDVLLTDVVMPGASGVVLAEKLRQRQPALKVLFMSGYTDTHAEVRDLADAGTHFLPKPFTPDQLARKIRAVIDTT